ncbi:MAG: hypothetical protein Q4G33_10135 [bacterium]|nr:hypothetical protein [bacterium]
MKTYVNEELGLTISSSVTYDKTDMSKRINDLDVALTEKFKKNAEREYKSMQIAKSFVTTV